MATTTKYFYLPILIFLSLAFIIRCDINPVQQFEADFEIFGNWSARFYNRDTEHPASLPFLTSATISPFSGHLYFDWNKQGIRVEVKEGAHSPWVVRTTFLQSSNVTNFDQNNYRVSSNFYTFVENKCFFYHYDFVVPKSVINIFQNITIIGTTIVDGVQCLLLQDQFDNLYYVRMSDMALIRALAPKSLFQPPPFFAFIGRLTADTWINFNNIKIGPVDSSKFKPPSFRCQEIPSEQANFFFDMFNQFLPIPTFKKQSLEKKNLKPQRTPSKNIPKPSAIVNNNSTLTPPLLTQAFTANFKLTTADHYGNLSFHGLIAMDFHKSGFLFRIDKTTGPNPFTMQTSIVVHPDRDGIEFLQTSASGSCWSYLFLQYLFTMLIPQFQVPPRSSYVGTQMIDGFKCNGWSYINSWTAPTFWVRESDNQLILLERKGDEYAWLKSVHLTNIQPFVEPNLYARPPYCAELNDWSTDFGSHLFWDWCDPFC